MMDQTEAADLERRIEALREKTGRLRSAVRESYLGNREVVELLLLALLGDGHVLLEGAPGLGKTTLVRALASALDLRFGRIQFTPDLMPADILGSRILEETPEGGHAFRFEKGPIFANVLLADEINRATPRTQSAMLEAMQERQVTAFGKSMPLQAPFCVVATQNPIEMEGTYPLPEAQLDRFLCKIELQPPTEDELVSILESTTGREPASVAAVLHGHELVEMRDIVRRVQVASDVLRLVARTIRATDPAFAKAPDSVRRYLRFGSSPRGGQAILMLAKARALLKGRVWVSDEDVQAVAAPALRHRFVLGYEGEASGIHPDDIVRDALASALG